MPAFGKRGLIAATAMVLAAIVIGVVAALAVLPADQQKPTVPKTQSEIRIDPAPSATPSKLVPAVEPSPPVRHPAARRTRPAPWPTAVAAPDRDPVTVTTINSW